jgi:hypothetical protein
MASDPVKIEYNSGFRDLEKLLSTVKRAGDFFFNATMEIPMPKVEVENVGVLSFPVPRSQIAALVQCATRAPYGRGEKTILDESVRKVWQLPSDKVRVTGKSWAASFETILRQAASGLGCEGIVVSAEFYKLLVYDTGGFFLAHRDTEKVSGMFATLVIVLPSPHRGGELVIRQGGRETTIDMSRVEFSEISFAAFYADCEHEVRPVTEGNRVCLVYNLIQRRDPKGKPETLEAPDYEKQIVAAAKLLEQKFAAPNAPAKIAWLLEHQYSPEGLAFAGLKSADAARVKVLCQAAEHAACVAHLGIVHIEESGAAQETCYDHNPRRRRGRYYDYDDEQKETEDESNDDFEVIDVFDARHYVAQWRDLRDQPAEFGEIPLEPGELLPDGALDDEKPDEQRYMEASGNEGASFERSYHRAALVLWRRERYAEVLLHAGVAAVLPYLNELIAARETKDARASARKEAVSLSRQLIGAWKAVAEHPDFRHPDRPDKRDGMIRLLIRLGESSLLQEFISEIVTRDYDGSENDVLAAGISLLGAKKAGELYAILIGAKMLQYHGCCVDLLKTLAARHEATEKQEWRRALRQMTQAAVSKLHEIGIKNLQDEDEWLDWDAPKKTRQLDAALATNLLDVTAKLGAVELRAQAVEQFADRLEVFDPVTILVPALESVQQWDAATSELWKHCAEFLLRRSGHPPDSPKDWRQDVKLPCACADCRELQAFTLAPAEQTHRFRLRKDRRQHLHQMIEKHNLDMTHVTERMGSPQTLVCTKDRRSYKRRCDEYRKEIAALTALENQAEKHGLVNQETLKGISIARALARCWLPD